MGSCHSKAAATEEEAPPSYGATAECNSDVKAAAADGAGATPAVTTTATPSSAAATTQSASNTHGANGTVAALPDASAPLPTDPKELRELVLTLQRALAARERELAARERELAAAKVQRVQSATSVLNASLKIIRPSTTSPNGTMMNGTGSLKARASHSTGLSLGGDQQPMAMHASNNSMSISPSLIQLHEKQKAAAAEAASVNAAAAAAAAAASTAADSSATAAAASAEPSPPSTPNASASAGFGSGMVVSPPHPVSVSSSLLPAPQSAHTAHSLSSAELDDSQLLRRELMDVLLAFAENELIVPNALPSPGGGNSGGGSSGLGEQQRTMSSESFAQVINQSSLDDITKQWLTAEFTRERPLGPGMHGYRQRHASVVNIGGVGGRVRDSWDSNSSSGNGRGNGSGAGSSGEYPSPGFSSRNLSGELVPRHQSNGGTGGDALGSIGEGGDASAGSSAGDSCVGTGHLHSTSRLLLSCPPEHSVPLSELSSWDFDVTAHSREVLLLQCVRMFTELDLLTRFAIPTGSMVCFLEELGRNYIDTNPYHNLEHGVDVLHCCWMFLRTTEVVAQARLRSLDILAFLLSAVCHDVGHPGTNNTFQIASGSELAMIYNDASVLENFHIATAFRILTTPASSLSAQTQSHALAQSQRGTPNPTPSPLLLSTLSRTEWIELRKTVIACILATDMSHHFGMVARLDVLFDKLERVGEANRAAGFWAHPLASPHAAPAAGASAAAAGSSSSSSSLAVPPALLRVRSRTHQQQPLPGGASSAAAADSSTAVAATVSPSPSSSSSSSAAAAAAAAAPAPPLELSRDEMVQLLGVLLHSADISNPAKVWRIAKCWGDRIQSENFCQGDLERMRGLPVSPFMDRAQENQPQTSINFIDFIVAPLQAAIVRAFPSLGVLAENLIKNRKIWHQSLLDRLSNQMRTLSGAALQAKEAERKALCNKAQIFRNCFVLPIRKIAHAHAIAANTPANAGVVAGAAAAPTTAAPAATGPVPVPASAVSASAALSTSDDEDEAATTQSRFVIQTDAPSKAAPASAAAAAAPPNAADSDQLPPVQAATPSPAAAGSDAAPSTSAAATAADFLSPSASGAPLVRSCSAEQLLARDAETRVLVASAADALLKSVQSIIKRRHSMIEQGRLGLAAGAEGGTSVAASRKNSRLAPLRLTPLSISQPNTPQLVALRARASTLAEQLSGGGSGARDPGHMQLLVLNPPTSPPRRASLSMAQAMISSGDDSATMDELASPVLSPESRAVAEAIGRGGSGASGRSGSAAGFFHDSVVPSPASAAPPVAVADE